MPGPTKPVSQHEWLKNLLGEWTTSMTMVMGPDQPEMHGEGTESVTSFGGLWAHAHGKSTMPDGDVMEYYMALGYDVTFGEYRGAWYANVSSHLWKYTGELSADGRTMTLNCEGPDMMSDEPGKTAKYRDVHELVDANTRTMTSFGEMPDGSWVQFNKTTYTRKA